jgi:hypothetical protein
MDDIQNEAFDLIQSHRQELKVRLDELVQKYRKYPDGFEFLFRGEDDKPEKCKIIDAYIFYVYDANGLPDSQSIAVWYRCYCPSWCLEDGVYVPISDKLLDRAIEKYGLHGPTTAKA